MSKELREKFKEETGHEAVFSSFGRIRPNWRYMHWLESKAGQHETIVMREITFLDEIIELCENEIFECELNQKGEPNAKDMVTLLKDFNEGRKMANNDTA